MKTLLALLSVGLVSTALGFDLVRDGRLAVRVDCGDSAEEQFAKAEFLRIMDAVTGCGTNESATAAGRIVIKVDPSPDAVDACAVRFDRTDVFLTGNNPFAAKFAMWELLERLGVRWYWPGTDGEYLPAKTKTLAIEPFEYKATAGIRYRWLDHHQLRSEFEQAKVLFQRHARLHRPVHWGGHSFGWIYPQDCKTIREYFEKYPEQFMMKKDGTRSMSQHCYTNPDTLKTFVDWVIRRWRENPELEEMGLGAMDNPNCCQCPGCKAQDSSTTYFSFISRIVEEVEKTCPGKHYTSIAYSFYLDPPKVKVHPAVHVDYCMYNRCYKHCFSDETCPRRGNPERMMQAWKDVLGKAPGIYGYHMDCFNYGAPFLTPMGRVLQDEIRWARDFGVEQWHTEWYAGSGPRPKGRNPPPPPRETGSLYANRFMIYAATRFLWDPDLDYLALKRDWCERVYGPAAEPMRKFLSALETAWAKDTTHVWYYNNAADKSVDTFITPELVEFIDAQFVAAEGLLAAHPDARAAGEVALEKAFWEKWRGLRKSHDFWKDLQAHPDQDRIDYFFAADPGKLIYPEKPPFKMEDLKGMRADGLFWGHRPHCFKDKGWINYEASFEFLFPDTPKKYDFLNFHLRCNRERFGIPYKQVQVNLSHQDYGVTTLIKHGQSTNNFPRTKFESPLSGTDWHVLRVRLADTKLRFWIDGKEICTADVPLGSGPINLMSYTQGFQFRNVEVHTLDEPTSDDLAAVRAKRSGKKARKDGTGRTIWE